MENIDTKLVPDEIFGEQCDTSNNVTCDTCEHKEDCELINKSINNTKDKGLSPQKYINDFGKTQEDIIELVTEDGFELDWLINRWDSVIEDKDMLKPILAVFPKYAKDMILILLKLILKLII